MSVEIIQNVSNKTPQVDMYIVQSESSQSYGGRAQQVDSSMDQQQT